MTAAGESVRQLLARAEVYRLLSRGLASTAPTPAEGYDADLRRALASAGWTGGGWRAQPRPLRGGFLEPAREGACPPYETEYTGAHVFMRVQQLADIAGFYKAFGVRVSGSFRERPDHLAPEMEFMYLLLVKEARALERKEMDNSEICRLAQARFLREHLGRWLDPYSRRLRSLRPRPAAARLAALARDFVAQEAQRLGVRPEIPAARRPHRRREPDMTCPAPGSEATGVA